MSVMAAAEAGTHPPIAAAALEVPSPWMPMHLQPPVLVTDAVAKDAIIAWYRGEFAAANAIVDALCGHLVELEAGQPEFYEAVFAAMHRRRMNWIPVLQMQKYHSISEVAMELKRAAAARTEDNESRSDNQAKETIWLDEKKDGKSVEAAESSGNGSVAGEIDDDSPVSDITDSGEQVMMQPISEEDSQVCSNHENCHGRRDLIKLTKGFKAKETQVNVLKGMKLYEEVFTSSEVSKLTNFVNELRLAGQRGDLSGESFVLFNQQIKGSKRELIQFGHPIFKPLQDESTNNNNNDELYGNTESIPDLLQGVIDHLIMWELIPAHKKPNGCIINFFDEGEYSQPFIKPPHLDHPISTLLLSESTMAFGRFLASDSEGNYRASLMQSMKEGSLLVMRGNSVDISRHAMCPSTSKRIAVTFFHVRPEYGTARSHGAPIVPSQYATLTNNEALEGYGAVDVVPNWGVVHTPVAVLTAPVLLTVPSLEKDLCGGTGVFLPWAERSRRRMRRLPPRAQKGGRYVE
ncbi:hypothetical protein SAY87_023552 [Trapa incisa]|uniref:Fe2OG dioxygenase domain-containing protein n=1 Tax=Trapa incisa TaxID=236973 RepID=A0AAN7QS91_9MYRT|nr:hypothetical protein SAY87_023552 [Trapa incisa]